MVKSNIEKYLGIIDLNETDFTKTVNNRTGASLNAKFFVIQIVVFSDLML